jgi:hypothetical protein
VAARQSKIRQHNDIVHWCYSANCFDFHNYSAKYDDIGSVTTVELRSSVDNGNWFLSLESEPCQGEFVTETFFVDGFEKAGAEFAVDGDGGSDNLAS